MGNVPDGSPDYNVCFYQRLPDGEVVKDDRRRRGWFKQVGVGWRSRNKTGRVDVQLDSIPLPLGEWNGKLTLFRVGEEQDDE